VCLGANDFTVFITLQAGLETGHFYEKKRGGYFADEKI
jgi:hypothetical protein